MLARFIRSKLDQKSKTLDRFFSTSKKKIIRKKMGITTVNNFHRGEVALRIQAKFDL